MPQGHRDRATRSNRTHHGGDHLISPAHGLLVTHSHDHIPEPDQLEVTAVVFGALLGARVPPLAVDLHDHPCAHQQVHSSDAGNPHLRRDPQPGVMQCESDERLGARVGPLVGQLQPSPPARGDDGLQGGEFACSDRSRSQGAVEHGDGNVARHATQTLRDRVEDSYPP